MDLVFIHGPLAAGKLTIARNVAEGLRYPLFHNHLIVDAVAAVFPFGTEAFVRLREQFWLTTFAEAAALGRPLVFTFAPEPTVPAGFPRRVVDTVEGAGGRVRFVALTVSEAEQERRIVAEDRARYGKLRSVDVLRSLRAGGGAESPPAELTIDTDVLSPEQAGRRIVEALRLTPLSPPYRAF
ncbi:shikimate kinase [Phenylobacterium sp.]|jgi:cytidylate kinase|uniref:shikimate kinase n=1 Tax=Phenylobacterium sp. TaxID=1871053 RepID=UPI002F3F6C2F